MAGTSLLDRLMRSPAYPCAVRWPLLALTAAIVALSFASPRHSEVNVGAVLIWQVWWALLPFLVLLTGRMWCAVCPFPALGDLARSAVRADRPMAPRVVRSLGPWLGAGSLAAFGGAFLLLALENNGPGTGVLLLAFATAAVACALPWKGQAWCRFACPIGMLLGLYSRLARARLVVRGDRREAAAAARGCPVFTSPTSPRGAHDCVMCAACVKAPGGEPVEVRAVGPEATDQRLAPAEAVAVSILLGLMLADALRMVPWYPRYIAASVSGLRWSYELSAAVGAVAVVVLVVIAHAALALATGRAAFGARYAALALTLLPVVLAAQLGLSSQHLLAFGEVARNLGAEAGLLEPGHMPPADAYAVVLPAKALQFGIIILGIAAAMRSAGRLAGTKPALAGIGAAAASGLALLAIFSQPMSVAC